MCACAQILVIAVLMKWVLARTFSVFQWEALLLLVAGITVNQLNYCKCAPSPFPFMENMTSHKRLRSAPYHQALQVLVHMDNHPETPGNPKHVPNVPMRAQAGLALLPTSTGYLLGATVAVDLVKPKPHPLGLSLPSTLAL